MRASCLPQTKGDTDGETETGRKGKLKKKRKEEAFIARDHTPGTSKVCQSLQKKNRSKNTSPMHYSKDNCVCLNITPDLILSII